jgi:lipoprotein-anchoring transpeptidase ErfK/SrfK
MPVAVGRALLCSRGALNGLRVLHVRRSSRSFPITRYAPRRRRRRTVPAARVVLFAFAAAGLGWVYWLRSAESVGSRRHDADRQGGSTRAAADSLASGNRAPEIDWTGGLLLNGADDAVESSAPDASGMLLALAPQEPTSRAAATDPGLRENADLAAARKLYQSGQVIEARHQLNAFLVRTDLTPAELADVRDLLATIANDTLFSSRRVPDDPLIETYVIQRGDVLINVAKRFDTPFEVIMQINNLRDPGRIREKQQLKVLRGPFHVKIDKSDCRLDLYLQDLYVRSYRVAVGAPDKITPEGVWKVAEKLPNPTYHPPPTAEVHEIIAADDPRNPLGEHWIGLEGVEGDTVGRTGFGIHGTIEPDSIGKPVSDGCIRMQNEDVAFIYGVLVSGKSRVTVLP